jgi:uncharacterized protein with beta-barrel porin domain
MKKRPLLTMILIATFWSSVGLAQRQSAVGPGVIPLNATGTLGGVDMSGSATTGTLSVGVAGGPQTDIFTLNNPVVAGRVAVSTAASSQGNITFNSSSNVFGAIGVTQPGGPFLLAISGGNPGSTVNFMGPVFATTLNVGGTGAMNFNSGSINITATNFGGDGSIGLGPNTTVIGALTTTAGANTGTLSLSAASILDGAVGGAVGLRSINVGGGSNNAGVTATITGATNAYAFSLGTNTLNVGGALTIANLGPSGVVNTTLASSSVYGNIRPVGATNLGPALTINVTVPSTSFIPVGSQFNIIQTQAGTVQSGTNGSLVAVTIQNPTNPLYAFSAVPLAGTVAGQVTIRTTAIPLLAPLLPPVVLPPVVAPPVVAPPVVVPPVVVPPVLVPPVVAPPVLVPPVVAPPVVAPVVVVPQLPVVAVVVPALLTATPVGDLGTIVLPALNALTTVAQVVDATAQLAPSSAALAVGSVTFQMTQQFQQLWQARLGNVLCNQFWQPDRENPAQPGKETCQSDDTRSGWWMNGFGYFATQGARQASTGYGAAIYGTMVGYDTPITPETRIGFGVGYARSNIDGRSFSSGNGGSSTNSDNLQATFYAGHERGPWFINGDVSLGWNNYSGSRSIVFPGLNRVASASYSGQNYAASVTSGYHFFARGLIITPLAALNFAHVDLGRYTETGAGDINLRVKSQRYNFLQSSLGVNLALPFAYGERAVVPEVHVKWLHELINPAIGNTVAFTAAGSPNFAVPGLRAAADTINLGAGLTLLSCACTAKTWALEAVYDYYLRNDRYSAHQVMLRFASRF